MAQDHDIIKIYDKCSEGYHRVDDFRAKLLGFLPLASGIAIFGALYVDPKSILSDNFPALGVFGVLITLGLLIYEMKGIAKCTQFIFLGTLIENKIKDSRKRDTESPGNFLTGYFTELSLRKKIWGNIVTEPVASAIIYSTVIAAWSYIIFLDVKDLRFIIPPFVFVFFATVVYTYWKIILRRIAKSFADEKELYLRTGEE
jgi:hypothetical protein